VPNHNACILVTVPIPDECRHFRVDAQLENLLALGHGSCRGCKAVQSGPHSRRETAHVKHAMAADVVVTEAATDKHISMDREFVTGNEIPRIVAHRCNIEARIGKRIVQPIGRPNRIDTRANNRTLTQAHDKISHTLLLAFGILCTATRTAMRAFLYSFWVPQSVGKARPVVPVRITSPDAVAQVMVCGNLRLTHQCIYKHKSGENTHAGALYQNRPA
jgi:hypothetical protein